MKEFKKNKYIFSPCKNDNSDFILLVISFGQHKFIMCHFLFEIRFRYLIQTYMYKFFTSIICIINVKKNHYHRFRYNQTLFLIKKNDTLYFYENEKLIKNLQMCIQYFINFTRMKNIF